MDSVAWKWVAQALVALALGARGLAGCDHQAPEQQKPALVFSRCTMCHVDIQEQVGQGRHAALGCESCHGDSQPHVSDEHNNVKPDRVFTPETSSELCGECHQEQLQKARAQAGPKPISPCITCHSGHRILSKKQPRKAARPTRGRCEEASMTAAHRRAPAYMRA